MSTFKDETGSSESLDDLRLFSAAVESAMDGIQIVDFEGRIIFSNKAIEIIYGYTHEELKGKHVNDMNVDPDFAEKEILPSIQKTGSWIGELMVKHKDGHHFPIWLNTSLVMNDEGNPIAMVGVIRDITESREAEDKLRLFSRAVENAIDGIQIVGTDRKIIYSNEMVEKMYGYTQEELYEKSANEIMSADPDFEKKVILPSIKETGSWSGETTGKRKDDTTFPVWLSISTILGDDNKPMAMVSVIRDISDVKEVNERIVTLIDALPDVIYFKDTESRNLVVNQAFANLTGLKKEEVEGKTDKELLPPDLAEHCKKQDEEVMRGGKLMRYVEENAFHGKRLFQETIKVPLANERGVVTGLVGITRDITERKEAEIRLRENEERYHALFETANDAILLADMETGIILDANKKSEELFGMTALDLIGLHHTQLHPEKMAKEYRKGFEESMLKEGSILPEMTIERKDGKVVPVEISEGVAQLKDRKVRIGIFRDITERKQAETRLRESEERFRGAFESTGVGASMASLKGQFIKVNNALCEMLGYKEQELLSKTFSDVTHPEDVNIGLDAAKKMVSGELTHTSFEKRYVRKDGQLINVVISPSIIRDSDGNPLHFMALFQDITKRKKAEKAIKESEERMRLLMESAQDIIIMQDMDGNYSYYNANPSYGLKKEDMLGKSPQDFHDKETAKKIMDRFKRVTKSGESLSEEILVNWQGEPLWMHEQTSPVRDSDGSIRGVVTIARNITEMKRLEEQLRHSQKMEAIGTLTTGIAHEFFNILTAIKGSAEFLDIDISKGSPLKSYVNVIQSSVERATRLTQSLLMYSRKQLVKMETMVLDEVAGHVINLISTLVIDDINVEFKCREKGLKVTADRDQLEQVMMNLAVNSIDAMPNGGTLTINIDTEDVDSQQVDEHAGIEPGRYALISVSDTGVGMDVKTQEKMFEPFFTTKDVGKGTGLGLSMVYGIVNKHNGYITVVSQPDRGSTFKIYLPLSSQGNIS